MDEASWVWVISIWLLCVGGAIGSFMNVVIYRLPAGISIVHPGSQCPHCQSPIRWHDNIPVFSWFMLGGRCRDCGRAFSFRYAAVEAFVALMFLLLGHWEGLQGGTNLPMPPDSPPVDGESFGTLSSWARCAFHLTLICTLICGALMQFDGKHVPIKLAVIACCIGLFAPLLGTNLHPVPAFHGVDMSLDTLMPIHGLVTGLAGVAAGAVLAFLTWLNRRKQDQSNLRSDVAWSGMVGAYLGWQAVAAMLASIALLGLAVFSLGRHAACIGHLAVAAIVWIVAWRPIVDRIPEFGYLASWKTFVVAAVCVSACAGFQRLWGGKHDSPSSSQ